MSQDDQSTATNTEESTASDEESEQPTYAFLEPRCPCCGSTDRENPVEGQPNSFDIHHVSVTCGNCGLHYEIEYRAIDVTWYSAVEERQSAVSQGLLEPDEFEYQLPEMYPALPEASILEAFDWPLECGCGERLTGNHIYSLDENTAARDLTGDHSFEGVVVFECPNCQDKTARLPSEE